MYKVRLRCDTGSLMIYKQGRKYLLKLFQQLLQLPLLANAPMKIIAFRLQLLSFSDNHHGRTSLSVLAWASLLAKIIQQYNYFLLFFVGGRRKGVSQTIWGWDPNNYFWGKFPFLM